MKLNMQFFSLRRIWLLLFTTVITAMAFAQDSTVASTSTSTSVTTEETTWYTQPWAWVVGGIIFLVIIILLVRGGGDRTGRTDKVTVTKSVKTDRDV